MEKNVISKFELLLVLYCLDVYYWWNNVTENYVKKMTRNTIEKTFQKKKGEQQRLKKRFLELPQGI